MAVTLDLETLPGGNLVVKGLRDLQAGSVTTEALLVLVGRPRLEGLGISVPPPRQGLTRPAEHALYLLLAAAHGDDAHSQYNALIRRLISFERALECASVVAEGGGRINP